MSPRSGVDTCGLLLVARSDGHSDETVMVGPYADLPFEPLSDHYGLDRGTPMDRRYIEAFPAEPAMRSGGRCWR